MCGIVGYIGKAMATPVLIDGLRRLEYRGYDSAGLATIDGGQLQIRKRAGRIQALADLLKENAAPGNVGISHTRWATHGRPTDENAHPHNWTNREGWRWSTTASSKIIRYCAPRLSRPGTRSNRRRTRKFSRI